MSQFVEDLLARVSIAAVVGPNVVWDSKKSRPAAGDYWACCPFHKEKTPSFHVDDQKGVYHCFGCKESGNAITFLRQYGKLDTREAIQQLADMVGMKVPPRSPQEEQRQASYQTLYDICEQAAAYFIKNLHSQSGTAARNYLRSRGLDDTCSEHFEIGFANDKKSSLTHHFINKDMTLESLVEAGLSAKSDRDGTPYDRFRNRIMFPIRDARGRLIGFGGRSLDSKTPAKYLNSPETSVFKKGLNLYHHAHARAALKESSTLIVAEGYMDVIALWQAGLKTCVAPLGTAISEGQIRQMWQMSSLPVIAFDGDQAGLKAAERLAHLALKLLEPGRSLRFAFLPEGTDPDDFVRQHGISAMQELIDHATDLNDFVWTTARRGHSCDTPEGSAALEAALKQATATIQNVTVRRHYEQLIRQKLYELSRRRWTGSFSSQSNKSSLGPSEELRKSALANATRADRFDRLIREKLILGICLTVPEIIDQFPERLESLKFERESHQKILNYIIGDIGKTKQNPQEFRDMINENCGAEIVDTLIQSKHLLPLQRAINTAGDRHHSNLVNRAETMLKEELDKVEAEDAVRQEFDELRCRDKEDETGDSLKLKRIGKAVESRHLAQRGINMAEASDYIEAENGVLINPEEKQAFDQLVKDFNK